MKRAIAVSCAFHLLLLAGILFWPIGPASQDLLGAPDAATLRVGLVAGFPGAGEGGGEPASSDPGVPEPSFSTSAPRASSRPVIDPKPKPKPITDRPATESPGPTHTQAEPPPDALASIVVPGPHPPDAEHDRTGSGTQARDAGAHGSDESAAGEGASLGRPGTAGGGGSGAGNGSSRGPGGGGGSDDGEGGRGTGNLLALIRHRLERAIRYPSAARRRGIEGTVIVCFRMTGSGDPENVEVQRSSGTTILDEAALETVQRASPFPYVAGRIEVPITFRLLQQ